MMTSGCVLFILSMGMVACAEIAPNYILNDGNRIPAIALGTYLGFGKDGVITSKNKQLRDVIAKAIDVGYRHIDTASIYGTEAEIGEAVRLKIDEGKVKREDIFITTKLWNTHHRREQVATALRESLERLGVNYVDLYLMHWPIGINEDYTLSDVDFMETWRGLEDMQRLGLARSIGVSNFNKEQLIRVMDEGSIKPAVLQVEVHPQIIQKELLELTQASGIVVMGYSPFGSLVSRYGMQFSGPKKDSPLLVRIAKKYGKTTPQVVLRWLVDRNVIPIPKAVNPKHLEENINIFDFKLEIGEIEEINKYDSGTRYTLPSFWQSHPYYPFDKVENPLSNPFLKV